MQREPEARALGDQIVKARVSEGTNVYGARRYSSQIKRSMTICRVCRQLQGGLDLGEFAVYEVEFKGGSGSGSAQCVGGQRLITLAAYQDYAKK